jgi:hypothetical protein
VQGVVLPCALQPQISLVRAWIGRHAQKDGLEKFAMMDDDVGFLVRRSPAVWNLRVAEPADCARMMRWMEMALGTYAQVGISAREGNNQQGVGTPFSLTALNARVMRVVGYRTEAFMSVHHCRTTVAEDFDVTLQILRAGGENVVSYWWAQGQRMTNEDGGCASWRTLEIHEEAMRKLAELHPGIVSLRTKQNKGDQNGLGTRTEVTVQWKAAAAEGQRLRESAVQSSDEARGHGHAGVPEQEDVRETSPGPVA